MHRLEHQALTPCAAIGCENTIPRRRLMCGPHWHMLPPDLQLDVNMAFAAWRHGHVSGRIYLQARWRAVLVVAQAEGKEVTEIKARLRQFDKEHP